MAFLSVFFHEVFYRPLLNALVFLTGIIPYHDLGFAVIFLTVLVRLILLPFTHHSVRSQAKMRALEPHIQKIKDELKDKQEEQAKRIMELYKEHGVNPFSSCVTVIIQLPILIALYRVFLTGLGAFNGNLYSFVVPPDHLHTIFLGLVNLSTVSYVLSGLAAVTQYIQMKWSLPKSAVSQNNQSGDMAQMMSSQMMYMMPVLIFILGLRFPSAVALYWTTMNIFAIIHEAIVRNKEKTILST